jgi:dipeptidyl aminopeptidase/acylaminoacyl peptidase
VKHNIAIICLIGCVIFLPVSGSGQDKQRILPSDCVTVRYVVDDDYHHAILINPQGTDEAYLLKSPDLENNRNNIELYVKPIANNSSRQGRLVLSSTKISELQWLNDGRHIVALMDWHARTVIARIDTRDGTYQVLVKKSRNIEEFSIDRGGNTLVFSLSDSADVLNHSSDPDGGARGYRIPFQRPGAASLPKRKIFVAKRRSTGGWSTPENLLIRSPFTGAKMDSVYCQEYLRLSLSPNGKLLLLSYVDTEELPNRWKASPFVQQLHNDGFPGVQVTVLQNLLTGKTTVPMKTPWTYGTPMWSLDNTAFLLAARSPVGSSWEVQDIREHIPSIHLFWADIITGRIGEVTKNVADAVEQPLSWNKKAGIVAQTGDHEIARFTFQGGEWSRASSMRIPIPGLWREIASDGTNVVGDVEAPAIPPRLFTYRLGKPEATVFTEIDPQFRNLTLAPVKQIQWKTSTGYPIRGFLFLPPHYLEGNRYPLVIQTKPGTGQFVCDSGQDHYPSFAPQPIANAGILYLVQDGSESMEREIEHAPEGYPGGIGEAAFNMDMWDSAVENLASKGMIDPAKVGIIGFSRSGWYTEFILSHSKIRYKAATATDNVHYSLGEYWLLHTESVIRGWDAMYGGPPYGPTIANWLKFSISFNLDKINTPLLLEEMGYGVPYDDDRLLPMNLAYSFEIFTGLSRLGKPVELYYYPTEAHQPDHPLARLASLQRNLDWYRFWLQGYERPNAEDPTEYPRWRKLERLQQIESEKNLSPVSQ